ncbi:Predicted dehydrogenase [Rhizobiales bacterium GAS191]|nr:Predicted dehydrogenase [Rhizobiales bacterium GAS191]
MQKAVLVGCGAMSRAWFEAARTIDGLAIVGVADLDIARAEARAAQFNLADAAIAPDLDTLLGRTKPDIVFDVAVPGARHGLVATALAAGCHVLSEKPMAETIADARDLVRRARAANRLHVVVQNRRYLGAVRRISRFVASGAIGEVTSLHCDFFLAPHFGGFREDMSHVLLLDMAIHTFDAARTMSGLDAEAVYCREWNPKNSWYSRDSSAAAIFELAGDVIFTYRGSWCADGLRSSWESAWRIVGTKGSIIWDGHDDIRAEGVGTTRSGLFDQAIALDVPPLDPTDRIGGHLGVLQDFIAGTRGGLEPETVGSKNIKSLAMVFGAIQSSKSEKRILIPSEG